MTRKEFRNRYKAHTTPNYGRKACFNAFKFNENNELIFTTSGERLSYCGNLRVFPITEMEINNEIDPSMSTLVFAEEECYTLLFKYGQLYIFAKTPWEFAAGCSYIIDHLAPEDLMTPYSLAFNRTLEDDRKEVAAT